MPRLILSRFRPYALRSASVIVVLSLIACDAKAGQGGDDAQSRKVRADSVRRAQRAAAAKTASAAPSAAAPPPAPVAAAPAVKKTTVVAAPRAKTSVRAPASSGRGASIASAKARAPRGVPGSAAAKATAPVGTSAAPPSAAAPVTAKPAAATQAPAPAPAAPTPAPATAPAPTSVAPAPEAPPATPTRTAIAPAVRRFTPRELDSVRARWRVETPVVWVASPLARRVSPGLGFATPSGYGPAWGDFFGSASYQQRTRFTSKADGAVGVGMGLGDPVQNLGGELVYSSFGTVNRGFFSNGTVSVRAHRIIRGYGVSAGFENVLEVGRQTSAGPDGGRSFFLVVSNLLRLGGIDSITTTEPSDGNELIWSIGIGDGRFRREADVAASKVTMNPFGSVGYRFAQRFAAIVDYTGQDVTVALSAAPFRCVPLVITPGFADITRSAGDGARFVLAVGFSTRFDKDAFFRRPCSP